MFLIELLKKEYKNRFIQVCGFLNRASFIRCFSPKMSFFHSGFPGNALCFAILF